MAALSVASTLSLPDAVWRGDQMGSYRAQTLATGYAALDKELPGGGWPPSALVELLPANPGIGEWRVLAPTLSSLTAAGKSLILLAPPHLPCATALQDLGIRLQQVILIDADKSADRVWAAEQALKSASFGALLCWFPLVRTDHLRRLQLAAAACDGVTFVFRPLSAQDQSSPAPLRLACHPAPEGSIAIDIFKRRGPVHAAPLFLSLPVPHTLQQPLAAHVSTPSSDRSHHVVDRTSSTAIASRRRTALPV